MSYVMQVCSVWDAPIFLLVLICVIHLMCYSSSFHSIYETFHLSSFRDKNFRCALSFLYHPQKQIFWQMFWAYWHFYFITTLHSLNFYLEIYWHNVRIKSFETHCRAGKVWNPLRKQRNNIVQEVSRFKNM